MRINNTPEEEVLKNNMRIWLQYFIDCSEAVELFHSWRYYRLGKLLIEIEGNVLSRGKISFTNEKATLSLKQKIYSCLPLTSQQEDLLCCLYIAMAYKPEKSETIAKEFIALFPKEGDKMEVSNEALYGFKKAVEKFNLRENKLQREIEDIQKKICASPR